MRKLTPHRSEMAKRNMKIINGIDYMISLNLDLNTAAYYMAKHIKLSETRVKEIYAIKWKYGTHVQSRLGTGN